MNARSGPSAPPPPHDAGAEDAPERRSRILRERAAALARPPASPARPEGLPVTCFTFAGADYAIETAFVSEVFLLDALTSIPGAPPILAGIVNRRGIILAVLDFKALLDLPQEGIADIHGVVVLRSDDMETGLLVDTLVGSTLLPAGKIRPAPASRTAFVRGVTADGLTLLDAARILSDPSLLLNASGEKAGGVS